MKQNVKRITEGSMMCAIVGVGLLINREMAGILDTILSWLLSLPIIIYTVRYGCKAALIPTVAMLLLSIMISMPASTFYLFAALIVGLGYGIACNLHARNGVKLALVIVLTFFSSLLTMVIFAGFFGYSPQEDIELIQTVFDLLKIQLPVNIVHLAFFISITMVVLISVLQGITIHLLAYMLMRRLKLSVQPLKSLFDLKVPRFIGWICIGVWLLFIGTYVVKLESNITMVCLCLYIIMTIFTIGYGCLSMMCFFIVKGQRKLVFILPIIALIPFLQMGLMVVGIADMLFDLRSRLK